jgi:membrane protein implicated in regulation of membrane protease activity
MGVLRIVLSIIGVLAALMGLLWIGQGTGIFPYPATSFMISQTPWIWRGAVLLVLGLVIVWAARRFIR